ncbi:hypothetical protein ACOMHN_058302 [Nucella lapillus]
MNLPNEIRKFCGHSSRLRMIFEDTKQCFQDINCTGNAHIVTAELLKEEKQEIVQTVAESPSFVVFGQTPYAKSRLINELFDKPVLPCLDQDACRGSQWRLVCFRQKFGRSTNSPFSPSNTHMADSYEFGDSFEAENQLSWETLLLEELVVPEADRKLKKDDGGSGNIACLEVILEHPLLEYGMQVVMAPSGHERLTTEAVKRCVGYGPSVLLYGFSSDSLSEKDIQDLNEISTVTNFQPVAFVRVPRPGSRTIDTDPPDGAPRSLCSISIQQGQPDPSVHTASLEQTSAHKHSQGRGYDHRSDSSPTSPTTTTISTEQFPSTGLHRHLCALGYLPGSSEEALNRQRLCQDYFMMDSLFIGSFQEFLPLFTQFARQAFQRYLVNSATVMNNSHTRCLNLFILSAFDMSRDMIITPKKLEFAQAKEEELYQSLMAVAVSKISEIKGIVAQTIQDLSDKIQQDAENFELTQHEEGKLWLKEVSLCAEKIQDMVLSQINDQVANKLLTSFHILRDSYTGTLTRCLKSLEEQTDSAQDVKTTDALKQILNAAYQVEITVRSSSSFISSLLEKMKQLRMSMPWKNPPEVNGEWKRKVATDMLSGLNKAKLARCIASQIRERLHDSHLAFAAALQQLQTRHTGRLDNIESQHLKLRKIHAPRLAKLALESTSLRDIVLFGMPSMGREVGRGQYGVVYSCEKWASYSPVAIKSVVPPDEKHWKDLALEFFYTKTIPEHPRVVMVRGSVIDYKYGGGMSPAVLLVMDRLQRDLHTAIMQNLGWCQRLQVAIDVVEGLRFLHSRGLIHRDVKLKNVLLDKENRGKISDLGFCKPEAMMSGSIVGTPIHMAPELMTGHYDNSVDVYAFGILFWYVCAGHVEMPLAFRHCVNKDDLWSDVRKGLRPERIPAFTDECWNLMQSSWKGEPTQRPYFGNVETLLRSMLAHSARRQDKSSGDGSAANAAERSPTRAKRKSCRISPSSSHPTSRQGHRM